MTKKLEELLNLPEVKEAIDKAEMDEVRDDDDLKDVVALDEPADENSLKNQDPKDLETINRKLDKIEEELRSWERDSDEKLSLEELIEETSEFLKRNRRTIH